MYKELIFVVLILSTLVGCGEEKANDSATPAYDSSAAAPTSTPPGGYPREEQPASTNNQNQTDMATKAQPEDEITIKTRELTQQRREVYNSLAAVKASIPDSLHNAKNQTERNYYNDVSFEVSTMQIKLLNEIDKLNSNVLQIRANTLSDIIGEYEKKVSKLEAFTNTLKDITGGINKLIKVAGFLIDKGIGIPKTTPQELQL